jgi:hypothetical protein
MADADTLRVPFSLRGISGLISASVTPNTDPGAIGYSLLTGGVPADAARGFPVCRDRPLPADAHPPTPIAGFSWGFTISQHDITLAPPAALGPSLGQSPRPAQNGLPRLDLRPGIPPRLTRPVGRRLFPPELAGHRVGCWSSEAGKIRARQRLPRRAALARPRRAVALSRRRCSDAHGRSA